MLEQQIIRDLERFADLDSNVAFSREGDDLLISFRQQGEPVSLRISLNAGRIVEERGGETNRYGSYRGLLMSAGFGNLKRLVEASLAFLRKEAPYIFARDEHLPIVGVMDGQLQDLGGTDLLANADNWLRTPADDGAIRTLVIDGPAGIGKTHLIRRLVVDRAMNFGPGSPPPILHVQSKGKKLSTLDDVLAGTLNSLRVSLTNDQVPVLIRNGLVHLAIDGFDELADPAGYETAWGSVVDLVNEVAGQGALILAGRDTFLDVNSVKSAVMALDKPSTTSAHLRPLKRNEAMSWLRHRISSENVTEVKEAGLLDDGSYALRPLFIRELSKFNDQEFDSEQFLTFPLKSLVTSIVRRESNILEKALRGEGPQSIYGLLDTFYKEVARFMADAESDSIELSSIDLIAELVFTDKVREDEVAMMRHRASGLALLEPDGSTTRRRFPHSEIQDYFLSKSYIELISVGSIPKSVRRNIIGGDFLETFHDVAASTDGSIIATWCMKVMETLRTERFPDRTSQNLGAMLLAASDSVELESENKVENISFDEVCIRGTSNQTSLRYVQIGHLDIRGADISAIRFDKCSVGTLLVDNTSVMPFDFPEDIRISIDVDGRPQVIFDPDSIRRWRVEHTKKGDGEADLSENIKLLEKVCRVVLRQHWIREIEEDRAGRLLQDPAWPVVQAALEERNLLRIRDGVAAGGPRSRFFRVEKASLLLEPGAADTDVVAIRRALS